MLGRLLGIEAKASKTAKLFAWASSGQPVWTPRDLAALAREGFAQNAVVYRSVRMIAEAAASVPLFLFDGEREVDTHPLLKLIRRRTRCNAGPTCSRPGTGICWSPATPISRLSSVGGVVARAACASPRPHEGGARAATAGRRPTTIRSAARRCASSRTRAPACAPILHLALFHPLNDHYGMSPLEAAATGIDLHNAAGAWNKALLDNSARPSGALVYTAKDAASSRPSNIDRLKAELEAELPGRAQRRPAAAAGRRARLEGDGASAPRTWTSSRRSTSQRARSRSPSACRRCCSAFPATTPMPITPRPTARSGGRRCCRWSSAPPRRCRAGSRRRFAGTDANPQPSASALELRPDLDAVEALSTEREALWERVRRSDFLTINEKRAAVGYGAVEGGDQLAGTPQQ